MGLFSKSKKVNEYEEASNNLNNEATTLASERVIFEQIQVNERIFSLNAMPNKPTRQAK